MMINFKALFYSLHSCLLVLIIAGHAEAQEQASCKQISYQGQAKVPPRLLTVMDKINQAYCQAEGQQVLTVTSGVRTAAHQARLMQSCLRQQACGYYANAEAAAQLQVAYNEAKSKDKVKAVAAQITAQMNRSEPCYISKHLTEYGLDIERWDNGHSADCQDDLNGDDKLLAQILNRSEDVANVIYKEGASCTHFHVNFVGWDQIPGLSRCQEPQIKSSTEK